MLGGVNPDDGSKEPTPTLSRLADALDIAPTAFFDVTGCELSQTVELLHLWNGIADKEVRAKVLTMIQDVSTRTGGGCPIAL